MPNPMVIAPKECKDLTWHPPKDVGFAAPFHLIPLHAGELAKAAATMPLAFIKERAQWSLVAVCGLEPGHNLFVRNGQWLGHYRPQWLDTWPFDLIEVKKRAFVTFDRDSGLLDKGAGEYFFDEKGAPGETFEKLTEKLKIQFARQKVTQAALHALSRAGVITPWPQQLCAEFGIGISGLHFVNEKAMAELSDENFLRLRQAQALPVAYAVNLSLPQAHLLVRLAKMNPPPAAVPENLEELFGEDDILRF